MYLPETGQSNFFKKFLHLFGNLWIIVAEVEKKLTDNEDVNVLCVLF
jgi:hypothetical protein